MKLVKKTDEYSIFQRRDNRYAVKNADKQPVNGEEKAKILLAEGLITLAAPAPAEAPAEEAAEESADAPAAEAADDSAEEAASDDAS
jgi:hypothetical protein